MQGAFNEARVHVYSTSIEIFMEEINKYPANFSDFEAYTPAT